jgi:hypothetical protein
VARSDGEVNAEEFVQDKRLAGGKEIGFRFSHDLPTGWQKEYGTPIGHLDSRSHAARQPQ